MTIRLLLVATALLGSCVVASTQTALAQSDNDVTASDVVAGPVLRSNVNVSSDVVRIGRFVDNAGSFAQVAIYRAPDLGTTGSLPVTPLLAKLRAHHVIGVDTGNLKEISVTRLARTLMPKDIETRDRTRAGATKRTWRCV